jgi:5-methylcytosine-specific restriction endonuclease McrA
MSRWVRVDHRYNQPYRLTGYAIRAIVKWTGLILLWVFVNATLAAAHLGLLELGTTGGLTWYAVHCARRNRALQPGKPASEPATPMATANYRFNAPPSWPTPPAGWSPQPGWRPDPSWPLAPPGWQFWLPFRGAVGERNTRTIPQDVKIAVSVRDQGRCVQCGSMEDLHYDHKIPWSKGGANTVNNIQLLCGMCNRRKGAEDNPIYLSLDGSGTLDLKPSFTAGAC